MQNLQRHRAIVTTILGEEDGGKAAASELTIDSVVVGERLFQAVVSRHGSGATLPALGPGLKRINAKADERVEVLLQGRRSGLILVGAGKEIRDDFARPGHFPETCR